MLLRTLNDFAIVRDSIETVRLKCICLFRRLKGVWGFEVKKSSDLHCFFLPGQTCQNPVLDTL